LYIIVLETNEKYLTHIFFSFDSNKGVNFFYLLILSILLTRDEYYSVINHLVYLKI